MEQEFLNRIHEDVSASSPHVLLGVGDDAAVLATRGSDTVLTVDMLTEGVDFLLDEVEPTLIGRKALAVNLSDLAAMSAVPTAILIAVSLPKTERQTGAGLMTPLALAESIFHGIRDLAEQYGVAIAGGDTNTWDGGLAIAITAIGKPTEYGVTRRDGAKVGDRIFVTGPLGGSILRHQFIFEPRVSEALYLNSHYEIHSAMDISDGLSLDLSRLAKASQCGAILWEAAIPISNDARRMNGGKTPLEHALHDGEDFELLFTVSAETAEKLLRDQPLASPLYEIGEITEPAGGLIRILNADDNLTDHVPNGFLH